MVHEHERVIALQYAEMFEAHAIEITEAFTSDDDGRLKSVLEWVRRNSTALVLGTATVASGVGGAITIDDRFDNDPLPEVIVECLVETQALAFESIKIVPARHEASDRGSFIPCRTIDPSKFPIKELGVDPVTHLPVVVKNGEFGEYVTDGQVKALIEVQTLSSELTSLGHLSF